MKKILLIITTFALVCSLTACGESTASDKDNKTSTTTTTAEVKLTGDELKAHLAAMLPDIEKARVTLLYGLTTDGVNATEIDEIGNIYQKVVSDKFKTVDDVKAFAHKYYTDNYISTEFKNVFEGESMAYKDIDGVLCMNTGIGAVGAYEWNSDEATLVSDTDIEVTLSCPYINDYGNPGTGELTFTKVENNWKVDNISYKING